MIVLNHNPNTHVELAGMQVTSIMLGLHGRKPWAKTTVHIA